jgi:hypothetical protein
MPDYLRSTELNRLHDARLPSILKLRGIPVWNKLRTMTGCGFPYHVIISSLTTSTRAL